MAHRRPKRSRCSTTQKLRFPDKQSAIWKIRSLEYNHPGKEYLPSRVYPCGMCHGWHLSSQEERS